VGLDFYSAQRVGSIEAFETGLKCVKIQANGIHINVRERGRGEPTLVLLRYWGGSSRTRAELIDQLVHARGP
jgi:hypothetical protein